MAQTCYLNSSLQTLFLLLLLLPARSRASVSRNSRWVSLCVSHRKIVSKIDEDKDGFVTVEELKAWIKFAQKRWIYEDVERQWKGHDLNEDGLISWEEYKNATYGYILGRFPGCPLTTVA